MKYNSNVKGLKANSPNLFRGFMHKIEGSFVPSFLTIKENNADITIPYKQEDNQSVILENKNGLIIHLEIVMNEKGTGNALSVFVPYKGYNWIFENLGDMSFITIESLTNRDNKYELTKEKY